MVNVTLVSQRLREVHFTNHIETSGKIEMTNSFNFHVDYAPDGKSCRAKLYQSAQMKDDPEKLFVSGEMMGIFRLEGIETDHDKQLAHVMCYDQLFPYLQSILTLTASASGLPGFLIQKRPMDPEKIVVNQPTKSEQLPIV